MDLYLASATLEGLEAQYITQLMATDLSLAGTGDVKEAGLGARKG